MILTDKVEKVVVTEANMSDYLGAPKYRFGEVEAEDMVGVVTGLAWTEVGGELLTIEGVIDARQGQDDRHGQPARGDEGIDFGSGILCPFAGHRFRHRAALLRQAGYPRARAGRRDAQGRPVCGYCHGDGNRLDPHQHRRAARHRHDRRSDPARGVSCQLAASRKSCWRPCAVASRRC